MAENTPETSTSIPTSVARPAADVHARVYWVLMAGMATSTVLYAFGLARALLRSDAVPLSTDWIRARYDLRGIAHGLLHADPFALLFTATAILIATPILRVAVAAWSFQREGDRAYARITMTVLAVVVLTVLLSRAGLR